MKIDYSGWSENHGSYRFVIPFDERKTDHEVRFESGTCLRQCGPFQHVAADWNNDGDVYTEFGAYFVRYDNDGTACAGREWWTPDDLVAELIDGLYGDDFPPRDRVVSISNIVVPSIDNRPSLDEVVSRTIRQDMGRDADRNRRMNALGIRPPGEPWAR